MVRHAARWRDSVTPGAPLDLTREMSGLTLAIVGETLFSSNVQGDADEVREALTDAVSNFAYAFIPGLDYLQKLPLPMFVRMRNGARAAGSRDSPGDCGAAIRQPHRRRLKRSPPPTRPDLISMLLAARDPENPNEGGMSDTQIRDEAMTIFLAGHETTANAMAWTWHLLGIGAGGRGAAARGARPPCSAAALPRRWRTCRSWSGRARSSRNRCGCSRRPGPWAGACSSHTRIGGHTIEKGALVIMSQWVVHRDPRWWNEPESFKPERWLRAPRRSRRSTRTSRSAAARASASASRSRGPRPSCCSRPSPNGGDSSAATQPAPTTEPTDYAAGRRG